MTREPVDAAVGGGRPEAAEFGESIRIGSEQHEAAERSPPSAVTMEVHRSNDHIARLPVQERLWVELGRRRASAVVLRVDTGGDAGSLMSNKENCMTWPPGFRGDGAMSVDSPSPLCPTPSNKLSPIGCR